MAKHTGRVVVYSVNAVSRSEAHIYAVTLKAALDMIGGTNPVARNVSPNRKKLTHIQLNRLNRDERQSPAMLTCGETMANAGVKGSDRYIEQVREKVSLWPYVNDSKAICVRPIIPEIDRLPLNDSGNVRAACVEPSPIA